MTTPTADTPPLPESSDPRPGDEPDPGDGQDVPAEKIYPDDPTGATPEP